MSYISIPKGIPGFNKAVISLWFRVSTKMIESAAGEAYNSADPQRMFRIIPLLVFGEFFDGYQVDTVPRGESTYVQTIKSYFDGTEAIVTTVTHSYSLGGKRVIGLPKKEDPSFIGVYCNTDPDTGDTIATLQIRLQTAKVGIGSWIDFSNSEHVSNYTSFAAADATAPQSEAYDTATQQCVTRADAGEPRQETTTPMDESSITLGQNGPDSFQLGPIYEGEDVDGRIIVKPDVWHHLLFSFDLARNTTALGALVFDQYSCSPDPFRTETEIRAIEQPCKAWLALDDKNYSGKSFADPRISPADLRPTGLGSQDIAPLWAINTTLATSAGLSANQWIETGARRVLNIEQGGMPTYNYQQGNLPTKDFAFGLPCVPAAVDRIRHCEMAEFQLFLGKTLDTNVEANRRAFIDYERDEDGNPIVDKDGNKFLKPVKMTEAEELLRKRPEIILHGVSNWKKGKNTGSLGVDDKGDIILSGQFEPTGTILKFKPDPLIKQAPTV